MYKVTSHMVNRLATVTAGEKLNFGRLLSNPQLSICTSKLKRLFLLEYFDQESVNSCS